MKFITLRLAENRGEIQLNTAQIVTLEIAAEKGAKTIVKTSYGNYYSLQSIEEIKKMIAETPSL